MEFYWPITNEPIFCRWHFLLIGQYLIFLYSLQITFTLTRNNTLARYPLSSQLMIMFSLLASFYFSDGIMDYLLLKCVNG